MKIYCVKYSSYKLSVFWNYLNTRVKKFMCLYHKCYLLVLRFVLPIPHSQSYFKYIDTYRTTRTSEARKEENGKTSKCCLDCRFKEVRETQERQTTYENVINLKRLFTTSIWELTLWRRSRADMNTRATSWLVEWVFDYSRLGRKSLHFTRYT